MLKYQGYARTMTCLTALAAMVLVGLTSVSAVAQGKVYCGPRTNVMASLKDNYSETPVSIGLANNGTVIEVFASKAGSFTIVMTRPGGLSCLIATGQNWETLKLQVAGVKA